ncbi:MAG: hypothetical protein DRG78_01975 [Epsilonproteobacteria bacterium]|nr:MAG: hypothetical protein DRG78_01975 [Campylobacterota bacterium]
MIIKSMSRANQTFYQLIRYFEKEQILNKFAWNLYSDLEDEAELTREFLDNAQYLKNSRGKVYLYHEILSLEKNNLTLEEQQQIINDLTKQYIQQRANNHLVYGVIHNDTNNLHMHLMISSNKVLEHKRTRLSKAQFKQIQKNLELYKNLTYKHQLKPTYIYLKPKVKEHIKEKIQEQEMKHRRKKQTKKEFVREQLQNIFKRSISKVALENSLKNKNFEINTRGLNIGVRFENKNYRLKTLGLDYEYKQTLTRFTKREKLREKRSEFKKEKTQSFYRSR